MRLLLLILLFRIDATKSEPIIDTFDLIEVNHIVNEWGIVRYDQLLCWNWSDQKQAYKCEWWKSMNDARNKDDKEKEAKYEKERRAFADSIKDWSLRKSFLDHSYYRGEFEGGKYYPVKNWRTGYWEIKYDNRIIRSKHFSVTYTNNDPEVENQKLFPRDRRKGLTGWDREIKYADEFPDFVGAILKNVLTN